jgi:hypothetical protein
VAIGAIARETSPAPTDDPLREENVALVNRLASLRALLDQATAETVSIRRRSARLRAENRQLRAALEERERGR